MTVKNISNRIIHIGTTALLPDKSMENNDGLFDTPSVAALLRVGKLVKVQDNQTPEAGKPAPAAEKKAAEPKPAAPKQ